MRKTSAKTRFIVPLLALVMAFAFAPAAFADDLVVGTMDDGSEAADTDTDTDAFGIGEALDNAEITFPNGTAYTYTGKEIRPSIAVWLDIDGNGTEDLLTEGTDYRVFYKQNVAVGTGLAYAWCQDSEHMYYAGATFTIKAAPISSATITVANQVYTGKKLTPAPVVKYNGLTLKKGTDYTVTYRKNLKVGTATAIVKGKGSYTGTKRVNFKITRASIANARMTNVKAKVYTGSKITPKITVKYKGKKLKLKRDYTVTYRNNKKVGVAKIIVRGKGNLKGRKVLQFTIKPASISKCKVNYDSGPWYWRGDFITPTTFVKYKGKTLKADRDYVVRYADNDVVGTAKIYIQGLGNFTGTKVFSFSIIQRPLSDSSITATPASGSTYTYSGQNVLPQVQLKMLINGRSYIISSNYYDVYYNGYLSGQVPDGVVAGSPTKDTTYTIRIQPKLGSKFFSGSRTIKYTILKQETTTSS